MHQLTLLDGKNEPDLTPLLVIRQADMIMHLWQKYISTALVPLAGTSVTVRREIGIFNNHVRVRIEGKVNSIVQRALDGELLGSLEPVRHTDLTLLTVIVLYLSHTLGKQKKGDFKPKNDELAFSRLNTEPCLLACDFLGKVREVTRSSLSGRNAEVFLTEVGVTFHSCVVPIACFVISPLTAHDVQTAPRTPQEVPSQRDRGSHVDQVSLCRLHAQPDGTDERLNRRDLALYQDTVATFSLTAISDRFEMLRQLGNVFIVQPDILRSYLNEGYLARIENRLLRPFVMCRSDYGDYPRKFWDDVFGSDELASAAGTAGGSAATGGSGGGAIASTLSRLPRLATLGSGTSAFSAQMQSLRASVSRNGAPIHPADTPEGRSSPSPASPRVLAPVPPSLPSRGGPPPQLPPRNAPSPVLQQGVPSRSNTPDPQQSGGGGSTSKKPSLFNSLMRDFEGLGLRDDGTGEFGAGSGRGGAGSDGGASLNKRGSLQSIRSNRE